MKVRFFLNLVLIFSFFDVHQALAMEPAANQMPTSRLDVALAKLAESGWVPSMARIPANNSAQSALGHDVYSCIPSSAGRCSGACCAPAPKAPTAVTKLELPQDAKELEETRQQLSKLLGKLVRSVGKSEAIKIATAKIDESSDSDDTQSSDSLNSPSGAEEDVLEAVRKK